MTNQDTAGSPWLNTPEAATSLHNQAVEYARQGAYALAQPLLEQALAIREQALGAEHPDTAATLHTLARLHEAQGQPEQAQPLYERALAIRATALGDSHPDTATTLNNLAALYEARGQAARALPLYERALTAREQTLGPQHPDTALVLNNLGNLLRGQRDYERAQPLLERALAVREQALGPDHPDTAQSLNNLAVLHAFQGQFDAALPLQERAFQIWQTQLGPHHPSTVQGRQSLIGMRQYALANDLPPAVLTAVQAQDGPALEQALTALPPKQAQTTVERLKAAELLDPAGEDAFTALLAAVAAVARGDDRPRARIEQTLGALEADGFRLTEAVQALWRGERDPAALTAGLDQTDTALIQRVLALLDDQ